MSISRTYRPKTFGDITGQDTVKETLRKEVASGKLGHAYLFSGPRGIGKTTAARIFAKALNCVDQKDGEPCNACASCQDMMNSRSLDVIEMDAASHTGVDNVREAIIEHVRFAPSGQRHKIYVLDEAHMLSTSAWNALLKTLEEPPSYAVFILATTELHKVPATIVSRCQRFDFRRVSEGQLERRVAWLAEQEGATVAPDVVKAVVRHADGCVRDAETLLDQLLALGEKNITMDVASLVMPISRIPVAAKLLSVAGSRTLGPALTEIARLEEEGIPFVPLFDDLIRATRYLLIASGDDAYRTKLASGDEGERILSDLIGTFAPAELSDMALLFMERRRDAKQGIDPRFSLELAMTAIAIGVLPNGPGTTKKEEGTIIAMHAATPVVSVIPPAPVESATTEPTISVDINLVRRKWHAIAKVVAEKTPSLNFILTISRPEAVEGRTVIIRFQYPFHRDKIVGDAKNKRMIEDVMKDILGSDICIDGVVGEDQIRAEKRSEDMVSNIIRAFGGSVVE
ncbi:MAG: DNA polymerase III subunit gamma/tau [Patescibacteria group bacterium]